MNNIKKNDDFQKSTNLVILETKEKIIDVLNQAKLPITVNQMIIKEAKETVDSIANQIIEKDRIQYENYLNSKKEGESNENS